MTTEQTPQMLFDANIGLAGHVMKRFAGRKLTPEVGHDDMYQQALISLWKACQPGNFDASRGVAFSSYAGTVIRNGIEEWIGTLFTQRRGRGRQTHVSVEADDEGDSRVFDVPSREPGPEQRAIKAEADTRNKQRAASVLQSFFRPKQRRALRLKHLDGLSWAEVAERCGYATAKAAKTVTSDAVAKFRYTRPRAVAYGRAQLYA